MRETRLRCGPVGDCDCDWRQQGVDEFERSASCAELRADVGSPARRGARPSWLLQRAADEGFQLRRIVNDYRSVGGGEGCDNVAEVAGVGAEGDRRAVGGGFDHVLAPAGAEATADEGDLCRAPPGAEFADGVDEQDGGEER